MPTIKITDNLGAEVSMDAGPGSTFGKYLTQTVGLNFGIPKLDFLEQPLPKTALHGGSLALNLDQNVPLGTDTAELSINATTGADLVVLRSKDEAIFQDNPFGSPIPIEKDECYLGLTFHASVAPAVSGKINNLSFGFNPEASIRLSNYRRFANADSPSLKDAFAATVKDFALPGDADDLINAQPGTVISLEGAASLQMSGDANLLALSNPLATLDLPGILPDPKIKAGVSAKVGAEYTVSGEFQVRVNKTGRDRLELGYYRKRGSQLDVKVSASATISVNAGKKDLIGGIFGELSSDPKLDRNGLLEVGVPKEQVDELESVVKAGIQRSAELAVQAAFARTRSNDAAFLFEIVPDALTPEGRQAINRALDGDLSVMHESLPGIRPVRSVFSDFRSSQFTLKVNLLGLLNYVSMTKLVSEGVKLYEYQTGDITITDTTTGSRIQAVGLPFAADSKKLRQVLAESFLFSATYRASTRVSGISTPELHAAQTYFEMHSDTNRQTMKDNLDIAVACSLLTRQEQAEMLGTTTSFGQTLTYADADYSDNLCLAAFFNGTAPRSQAEFENIGRQALGSLIREDDVEQAHRRPPLVDDGLWQRMRKAGRPNLWTFPEFKRLSPPLREAIGGDYVTIVWWAESMAGFAAKLHQIREFVTTHPDAGVEDNRFKKLHGELVNRMRAVVRDSGARLGDPWVLVAMDIATGRRADLNIRISCPVLAVTCPRTRTAAALAA